MIVFFIIYRLYFHFQGKRTDVACLGLQQTRKYVMIAKTDILEVNAKSYVAIRTMENFASFTAIVQKRIVTTFLDVKMVHQHIDKT